MKPRFRENLPVALLLLMRHCVFCYFRSTPPIGSYLIPEHFQQRNMDLIQSIKNFLQNDETKFDEFKNYSGQFRQVNLKWDPQVSFQIFDF